MVEALYEISPCCACVYSRMSLTVLEARYPEHMLYYNTFLRTKFKEMRLVAG